MENLRNLPLKLENSTSLSLINRSSGRKSVRIDNSINQFDRIDIFSLLHSTTAQNTLF